MAPSRRQRRPEEEEEEEDLFGKLPDDLLILILSFLPSKAAVQTCILSRRWSRLWAFLPNLDVDDRHFSSYDHFIQFVRNASLLREDQPIRSLKICIHQQPDCSSPSLHHAFLRGLEKLHLEYFLPDPPPSDDVEGYWSFALPSFLSTASSLKEMFLDVYYTWFYWPAPLSLVSLKKLRLNRAFCTTTMASLISSCCPALEDWTMADCLLPDSFVVSCPRLEHFNLSNCGGCSTQLILSADHLITFSLRNGLFTNPPALLKISSSSLTSFTWDSEPSKNLHISNSNSLVLASVNIQGDANSPRPLKQLMRGLSKTTKLQLTRQTLAALAHPEASLTPNLYGDLRILELGSSFDKDELLGMTSLLRCCPKLNVLVVTTIVRRDTLTIHHRKTLDLEVRESMQAQNLLLEQLRTVEFREFMGSEVETDIVFYLLGVAKSLTNITVIPAVVSTFSWRIAKRLCEMQKHPKLDVTFPSVPDEKSRNDKS